MNIKYMFLASYYLLIIIQNFPSKWLVVNLLCLLNSRKLIHAGSLTGAFLIAAVALQQIFNFHNLKDIPNMYTLHSWIGLLFVVIFGIQERSTTECPHKDF